MSDLQRENAPFSAAAWAEIDQEAKRVLEMYLAGRKLCDFNGPLGWNVATLDMGRTRPMDKPPAEGVQAALRLSQPLLELRVPLSLSRRELQAIDRGAKDVDLDPVVNAAKALARAEDNLIFNGYKDACILGIGEASASRAVSLSEDYLHYPDAVAAALDKLRGDAVGGPYGLALGPRCYAGLTSTRTEAGYPVMRHVRQLVDGPIVWAPAIDGAILMSLRGGDFELTVGRDISIGYHDHNGDQVELYLQESLTFRTFAPEAAVPLRYA